MADVIAFCVKTPFYILWRLDHGGTRKRHTRINWHL